MLMHMQRMTQSYTSGPVPARPDSARSHHSFPGVLFGLYGHRDLNTSSVRFRIMASILASLASWSATAWSSRSPRSCAVTPMYRCSWAKGASAALVAAARLAARDVSTVFWQYVNSRWRAAHPANVSGRSPFTSSHCCATHPSSLSTLWHTCLLVSRLCLPSPHRGVGQLLG